MFVASLAACGAEDNPSTGSLGNMPSFPNAGGSAGSQPVGMTGLGGAAPGAGGTGQVGVGGSESNPPVMGISGGSNGGSNAGSTGGSGAMPQGGSGGGPVVMQPMVAPTFAGCAPFPQAQGQQTQLDETMNVSGTFDGGMRRFVGTGDLGGDDQAEGQDPMFELANNATIRNVILGSPAADGIHCLGNCTLENVWWEDVGEDAATFLGESDNTRVSINCGGARQAADKAMQHNGGGTVVINNFYIESFGKLYRSCGNCDEAFDRHVEITNLVGRAPGGSLVGVNSNFGDTATLRNIFLVDATRSITVCERYTGNDSGDEPVLTGAGPDAQTCLYTFPDVQYVAP